MHIITYLDEKKSKFRLLPNKDENNTFFERLTHSSKVFLGRFHLHDEIWPNASQ
jgi:hypothetical protein